MNATFRVVSIQGFQVLLSGFEISSKIEASISFSEVKKKVGFVGCFVRKMYFGSNSVRYVRLKHELTNEFTNIRT